MSKVDLDKLRLAISPLTGEAFVGIFDKNGNWKHKKEVSSDFLKSVVQRFSTESKHEKTIESKGSGLLYTVSIEES